MKPAPVITENFLERIAEPTSPFHSDYLAYQKREIRQAQLITRLPHIAMIGDSVCMDVCISSVWSTFWRARTCRGKNWFLGVGALVDHERDRQNFFRKILRTHNFSGQITQG